MLSSSIDNLKKLFNNLSKKLKSSKLSQSQKIFPILGIIFFFFLFVGSLFWSSDDAQEFKSSDQKNRLFSSEKEGFFEKDFHQDVQEHLQIKLAQKDQHLKLIEAQSEQRDLKYEKLEHDFSSLHSKLEDLTEKLNSHQNYQEQISQIVQEQSYEIDSLINSQERVGSSSLPTSSDRHSSINQKPLFSLSILKDDMKATVKNYIPAGTFVSAKLLGGIDVSTNPNAQKNPQPLLLHLTDLAQLPSLENSDIRHCRVTAQAWGDLSSERAYARSDRLSCVLKNGDIIDTPIQAFLVDETGKNGIRGDVVARHEGSMITQAFLSKFIGALGGVADTLAQSHLQSQENISWSDASKGSLLSTAGKGVSGVGDTLENYFISRLNELSPVIQILADKRVDVVFTQGVLLEPISLNS